MSGVTGLLVVCWLVAQTSTTSSFMEGVAACARAGAKAIRMRAESQTSKVAEVSLRVIKPEIVSFA